MYLKKYGPKNSLLILFFSLGLCITRFSFIQIHDSCKRHWARNAGCLCIGEREYKAEKFFFPYFIVNFVLTLKLDNFFCFVFYTRKKNYKADHKLTKSQRERTCLKIYLIPLFKCYKKKCEEQNWIIFFLK